MKSLSRASGLVLLAAVLLVSAGNAAAQCPATTAPDEVRVTITRQGDKLKVDKQTVQIKGDKHTILWCYEDPDPIGFPIIVWAKTSPFDAKLTHIGKKVTSGKARKVLVKTTFSYSIVVAVLGKDPLILDPDVEVQP